MTTEVLQTLLLNCIPFAIALAIWFYQWIICRLPEKQRQALDHFAHLAVRRTEQLIGAASGDDKKTVAIRLIGDLFRTFHLPIPPDLALDTALEAAVYELNLACGKAQREHSDGDPFGPQTRPMRAL